MNVTNVILSVIAVGVIIVAVVVVYQWNQQEQDRRAIQDAISRVKEQKEQALLQRINDSSVPPDNVTSIGKCLTDNGTHDIDPSKIGFCTDKFGDQ
jgi:sensor domain CHASE-containing protein